MGSSLGQRTVTFHAEARIPHISLPSGPITICDEDFDYLDELNYFIFRIYIKDEQLYFRKLLRNLNNFIRT